MFTSLVVLGCTSLQFPTRMRRSSRPIHTEGFEAKDICRRNVLRTCFLAFLSTGVIPQDAVAKSYSANARNLERMNTGDMSGGSVYDNNPKSEAGKRRRAVPIISGCGRDSDEPRRLRGKLGRDDSLTVSINAFLARCQGPDAPPLASRLVSFPGINWRDMAAPAVQR